MTTAYGNFATDAPARSHGPRRAALPSAAAPAPDFAGPDAIRASAAVGRAALVVAVVGMLAAAALFAGSSYRMLSWSRAAADEGRWAAAGAAALLALVALLAGARWCAFMGMAIVGHRRDARAAPPRLSRWPAVSVLAPAFNEAATIEAAVESLLRLDYPRYEVVVVDDGSTDDTLRLASRYEGDHGRCAVRVLTKPNGGKWSALNFAFRHAASELVLCVDADSRLGPDALRRLVARMADPSVSAVAGQVRVRNRENLVTRLQGLEYVISNGLIRAAQSLWGAVLVVPGPIGLFRRSALEAVYLRYGDVPARAPGDVPGPFEGDTFAEDFDLSLSILALGGRIVYEPLAVSHTKAPHTPARLLNQRYRWCRGTIQVLRKFLRRAAESPDVLRPRLVAWLAVTYVAELFMIPAANALGVGFLAAFLAGGGDPVPLLGWAAAFLLVSLNTTAYFVAVHCDTPRSLAVLPAYDLYHGFLLNSGWAIAVFDELRGTRMRW